MFKLVALFVLLGAASKFVQSAKTPLSKLNDYVNSKFKELDDSADSFGLPLHIVQSQLKAVDYCRADGEVRQLAGQLLMLEQIDHGRICGRRNLEILRKVLPLFIEHDTNNWFKIAKRKLPLSSFVLRYTKAVVNKCLDAFEKDFKSVSSADEIRNIHGLSWMIFYGYKNVEPREAESISVARVFDENNIPTMISRMHCDIVTNGSHDHRLKVDFEVAKIYLKKYLFEPCKALLADDKYSDLFKKITAMSEAALFVKYYPKYEWVKYSLGWASAAAACETLGDGDLEKFAKIISESNGESFNKCGCL